MMSSVNNILKWNKLPAKKELFIATLIGLTLSFVLSFRTVKDSFNNDKSLCLDLIQVDSLLSLNDTSLIKNIPVIKNEFSDIKRDILNEKNQTFKQKSSDELLKGIFIFVSTSAISFFLLLLVKIFRNSSHINVLYMAIDIYNHLISSHYNISEPLASLIGKKVKDPDALGGIAFISIDEEKYMIWLEDYLSASTHSYKSTLTYHPTWFFKDEKDLSSTKKLKFLRVVNDNVSGKREKSLKNKSFFGRKEKNNYECIRLMIFSKKEFVEEFKTEFWNGNNKEFNKLHKYIDLYFIDKDILIKRIVQSDLNINNAIYDDFALVDESFVLKKDKGLGASIIFGKLSEYKSLFKKVWESCDDILYKIKTSNDSNDTSLTLEQLVSQLKKDIEEEEKVKAQAKAIVTKNEPVDNDTGTTATDNEPAKIKE